MIFRTINTDAKKLTEQFGLLNKSFRDIKKDFANGLGFKNSLFQTSISKTDYQALQKFNSAIKVTNDGLTKSQRITKAWNENMTGCSMAAKRMGNDLITGKKKISDVSNSMKTATASTKALGVAMNVFANVGFMLAITAVTKVVTELAQAQSKAVEAANEATESYKEELVSLEDYKTKISELHEELSSENISYKDSKTIREELLTLQDELIKKYGNEKTAIENITTAIKGEVNALDELNEKAYRDWIAKADKRNGWNKLLPWGQSGLDQAIDYMETEKTVSFFDMQNANLSEELQTIQKEIDETIQSKYNLDKTFAMFNVTGRPNEIKEQLDNILQDYMDLSKDIFTEKGIDSRLWGDYRKEVVDSINKAKNEVDKGLNEHQETYKTYIEGLIKYDSEYSDEYANILQKRAELESAQNSGNEEEIQKARQAFMDAINKGIEESDSNENIRKYFESLYPELQSEFSDWAFEFDLKANVKGLKDVANEIGEKYTATDLLGMVNDDSVVIADSAFNSLIDKAIEYGVCVDKSAEEVQKLIDLLVALGIVQGNVQGSTSGDEANISYDTLTQQFKDASDSAKSLRSSISDLNNAFSEQNQNNQISVDTMLDLVEAGFATALSYDKATKSYVLNKDAALELVRAKILEQNIDIQRKQGDIVQTLNSELDGVKTTTEGYYDLIKAKRLNATTDQLLAMEQYNNLEAQKKALVDAYANWDEIVQGNYSTKSSTKSPSDKAKEQFEEITTLYKSQYQEIDHVVNLINGKLEEVDTLDLIAGKSFYSSLIEQENKRLEVLLSEYQDKIEEFENAVNSGIVEEGSDAWISMQTNIDSVVESIQDANNQILKYEKSMKEIVKLKFDDINKQFDNAVGLITSDISQMEKQLSLVEEAGYNAGKSFYETLADAQISNTEGLVQQYEELSTILAEGLADGSIQQFSDNWYEMYSDISSVEDALLDAQSALLEYQTALRELDWDTFDREQDYISNLIKDSDFLIDLYETKDLFDDSGNMTNNGLAVQGLHVANYEIYRQQAQDYADEMEEINKQLAEDPYNQILIDRYEELADSRRDAILAMEDEKQAVIDLKRDGYDELLSTFDDLISSQKSALRSAKDLYDYQNTIEKQTASIEQYRKQLLAYQGDDSEQMKAIIQKTTESLKQAEADLAETEYDKYISDQEAMLDTFNNELQEWVNARLDNVEGMFDKAVDETNVNSKVIADTLGSNISSIGETLFGSIDGGFSSVSQMVREKLDNLKDSAEKSNVESSELNEMLSQKLPELMTAIPSMNETNSKIVDVKNAINLVKSALDSIGVLITELDLGGSSYVPVSAPNNTAQEEEIEQKAPDTTNAGKVNIYDMFTGELVGQVSSDATRFEIDELADKLGIDPTRLTDSVPKESKTEYQVYDIDTGITKATFPDYPTFAQLDKIANDEEMDVRDLAVKKIKGYAKGVHRLKKDELALTQEDGMELILSSSRNAVLTPLKTGDTVLTKVQTDNMFEWSKINPEVLQKMTEGIQARMIPNVMTNLPTIERKANNNNTPVNVEVAFNIPNVTNTDEFIKFVQTDSRFEKILHTSVSDAMLGKGSFGKYKY